VPTAAQDAIPMPRRGLQSVMCARRFATVHSMPRTALRIFRRGRRGVLQSRQKPRSRHHRQMSQDQPEAPREQLARQATEAYNELTAHSGALSPEAAQAARSLRNTLTSLVALGTAADLQIAEMERTMAEFEAIFYGGEITVSARLLRRHLSVDQRTELARLITEP